MYIFNSEWKRSVVHTGICLNEKNSSISSVWWTLLPGCGARTKSQVRNLASPLITITNNNYYFIFIDKFILFCKLHLLAMVMRNKSSIRQGKKQTKSAGQLQHNGSFTKATAAELSVHSLKWAQCIDFVINLTSKFENHVWWCLHLQQWFCVLVEIYNNLFPHVSLHEDLLTHSTHCMQIIIKARFQFPHCVMKNVLFPKVITIIKLIYLFWSKMEQTLPRFGVTRLTSASASAWFLIPFPGSYATWLRRSLHSKALSTSHSWKTNRGKPW